MNSRKATRTIPGFTLIELLLVISIIGILAALLLPVLNQGQKKARRAQCVSDLKQLGLAFHSFMHDHNSLFPMQVSTNYGGTLEFVMASYKVAGEFYFQYRHFQALSNELNTPKLLFCPADRARIAAADFVEFSNVNVSYFVGANAEYDNPNSILAGDRNITYATGVSGSIIRLTDGVMVNWTGEMHEFKGNVLYADGRVAELNGGLPWAASDTSQMMDLINPSVRPVGGPLATPATPPQPPLYPPPAFGVAQSLSSSPARQSASAANNNAKPPATASAPASTPTRTSPWAIPLSSSSARSASPARLATNTSTNAHANTNAGVVGDVGIEKAVVILANTPIVPPPAAVNRLWWLLLLLLCLILLVWRIARRRSPGKADAEEEDA